MLQTKIPTNTESFEIRHARIQALNAENRAISIEKLVEMSNNAGMPLIQHYHNIGELVDSTPKAIQSIEYMGNKKIGMIYDTLERLLREQADKVSEDNVTRLEVAKPRETFQSDQISEKNNNVTPISAKQEKNTEGSNPIVITEEALEILTAKYLGCDVEVYENPEGKYEGKIFVRFLAPIIGRDGREIEKIIVGAAASAPKPPKDTKVDTNRVERADKWLGEETRAVSFADVAMLIRAGLADIDGNEIVLTEEGDAYCFENIGNAIDYTATESFDFEPELPEDYEVPEIEIGKNPNFTVNHVVGQANRLEVKAKNKKLVFVVPGKKESKSKAIDLVTTETLARFFNRAPRQEEDCGIEFDGVSAAVENGKILLRFDTDYPDPFMHAEVSLSSGNSGALADHLLAIAHEEADEMTLIHLDVKIIDELAIDPDSLRV